MFIKALLESLHLNYNLMYTTNKDINKYIDETKINKHFKSNNEKFLFYILCHKESKEKAYIHMKKYKMFN